MKSSRVEAFSDGVIAIIITIMVLELEAPHTAHLAGLKPLVPVFLIYVLSFIYLAIYWNNHHHLFHAVEKVDAPVLWANAHLLFWLSLIPFVTSWMGHNHFERMPVALYGVVLLCCAIAYYILTRILVAHHEKDSTLSRALIKDRKGKISMALYAVAIALAFVAGWIASVFYIVVAVIWLVPEPKIEERLKQAEASRAGASDAS